VRCNNGAVPQSFIEYEYNFDENKAQIKGVVTNFNKISDFSKIPIH
jgi:hypothetical protein